MLVLPILEQCRIGKGVDDASASLIRNQCRPQLRCVGDRGTAIHLASTAQPAAVGDLATSILALLAIAALRSRLGIVLVWAFNLLGSADLLHAFYEGNRTSIRLDPGLQGAAYFIPTVLVPLLLITHGLVFRLLLRKDTAARPA